MPIVLIQNQQQQPPIFYERHGDGHSTLLLLSGSLGLNLSLSASLLITLFLLGTGKLEFSKQIDYFDRETFTLVTADAPGFGQSWPPEREYTSGCYERDAKLLSVLMQEHLEVNQFNLLGFSDGGRTAIELAGQFPEMVARLILVGTTAFNSPKEMRVLELCRSIDGWSSERRKLYEGIYGTQLQSVWNRWLDWNKTLKDFLTPQLAKIVCPTLVIYGENDLIAPVVPHVQSMKKHLKKCEVHIMPGASHYCHQDKPVQFNQIVEKFLLKK